MAHSIRHQLISKARQALDHIEALDYCLYAMNELHQGRQEAIPEYTPLLLEAHEQLRSAWKLLLARL